MVENLLSLTTQPRINMPQPLGATVFLQNSVYHKSTPHRPPTLACGTTKQTSRSFLRWVCLHRPTRLVFIDLLGFSSLESYFYNLLELLVIQVQNGNVRNIAVPVGESYRSRECIFLSIFFLCDLCDCFISASRVVRLLSSLPAASPVERQSLSRPAKTETNPRSSVTPWVSSCTIIFAINFVAFLIHHLRFYLSASYSRWC